MNRGTPASFLEDLIDACVMECYFHEHMAERDLLFHDTLGRTSRRLKLPTITFNLLGSSIQNHDPQKTASLVFSSTSS